MTIEHLINLVNSIEPVKSIKLNRFKEKIIIQAKKDVIKKVKKYQPGLVIWTDRSKLENRYLKSAIYQREKNVFLDKNKEILYVKLQAILTTLDVIVKKILNVKDTPITIFYNLQKVLKIIRNLLSIKNIGF